MTWEERSLLRRCGSGRQSKLFGVMESHSVIVVLSLCCLFHLFLFCLFLFVCLEKETTLPTRSRGWDALWTGTGSSSQWTM